MTSLITDPEKVRIDEMTPDEDEVRERMDGLTDRSMPRYLALAFGPLPGTPPPLFGFLQSLHVRRLFHLGPGLLDVSGGVSHVFEQRRGTLKRRAVKSPPLWKARPVNGIKSEALRTSAGDRPL